MKCTIDFVQDRKRAFMNLLEVESNAEEQTVLIAHILAYLRPKFAPNIPRSFHECWCGLSCFFFLQSQIQRSHCYDQDVAGYAHSALAVVGSVLYQSPGLCVQEVWEPCLGLPQSGLHLVSMCPLC